MSGQAGREASDDTLAGIAWETLAAQAGTLQGRPDSTIKPRDSSLGTTGQSALEGFLVGLGAGVGVDPQARRLELGPVIGEGGMGVVHLARQTAMGRDVAVKALRPHLREPGPTLKLLQEAWTAARLEHPNILPVYDITVDEDGSPLIVLKRIDGESWAELLAAPQRARELYGAEDLLEWNLQILIAACNAIHFAHDRGVLHRDIKPENVMLGQHGEVYVVDWGIAVALTDDGSGRLPLASASRGIVGTPSYMAPEMLLGDGAELSERTDVYLLGATLYELLAGRAPHRGATIMEVLATIVSEDPQLPDEVPAELAAICRAAMARAPSERLDSADALRRELLGFLRHRESDRLASEADQRLVELEALLADPPRAAAEVSARDALFTQARFGFEQALASWPDNEAARAGLRRVITATVEYELDHGDPQAAAALASGASGSTSGAALPAALIARLDAAVERRRASLDELVQLRHDSDLSIGQRTRAFVITILGLLWTVTPFVEQFVFEEGELGRSWAYVPLPLASLLLLAGLAIWARESLTRTRVNRIVVLTLAMGLLAQLASMLGGTLLGLTYYESTALLPLLWALLIGMVALTYESRAWPIALTYFGGYFASAALPDWRFAVLGVCNLVFMVVLLIAWWPQRLRGPIAETDHRA